MDSLSGAAAQNRRRRPPRHCRHSFPVHRRLMERYLPRTEQLVVSSRWLLW